jgi:hypothetical protein
MISRRHARPVIALVAAYSIALQAFFAGLLLTTYVSEAAAFPASVFCLQNQSHPDGHPLDRMPCCASQACCSSASAGGLGALPALQALPYPAVSSARAPIAVWRETPRIAYRAQSHPRAPPA